MLPVKFRSHTYRAILSRWNIREPGICRCKYRLGLVVPISINLQLQILEIEYIISSTSCLLRAKACLASWSRMRDIRHSMAFARYLDEKRAHLGNGSVNCENSKVGDQICSSSKWVQSSYIRVGFSSGTNLMGETKCKHIKRPTSNLVPLSFVYW